MFRLVGGFASLSHRNPPLDLSFARVSPFGSAVTALPAELAVLLAGVVARQAASPTARVQARLAIAVDAPGLVLAPASGAFHAAAAAALRRWQGE
jgi:hypothetical protein